MITSMFSGGADLVAPHTSYDQRGEPFTIRAYGSGDSLELQRFYEAFEPKRAAQGLPPAEPHRIRSWLKMVLGSGIHLVATREGELIAHAFILPTGRSGVGEYAVFLRDDVRSRGIGTQLNAAAIAAASAAGLEGLWLTVEPENRAAVRSYEKVDFRFVPGTVFSLEAEMERTL